MASFQDKIQSRVGKIKETLLVRVIENPSSFVSTSAYDTAWLAMVGDPKENDEQPMFKTCLEWVLSNQNPEGFWGERDCHGNPTIDALPASLACMVALKMWDMGREQIEKGMSFLVENSTKLLKRKDNICNNKDYPRWFAIVFPGMVEVARLRGLEIMFANNQVIKEAVANRQHILSMESLVDKVQYPPLLSYLEVLPSSFHVHPATIINNLSDDGSLFRSPAATAAAYMATRNSKTLSFLCDLVQSYGGGVPSMYPIDEDCLKLYMLNHLQRLGLSEYFYDEIRVISNEIYSRYNEQEVSKEGFVQTNISKNSLAFEVLRLQGYEVSPRRFCGLLEDEHVLQFIEENHDIFASMLYNLYRAANLMFESEVELQGLGSFSRRLLEKLSSSSKTIDDGVMMWPRLQELVKRELFVPWMARLDHLAHRDWIEANKESPLWLGKASYYRISCLENMDLLRLAKENYEFRQMVYKKELLELLRWSKDWGLTGMDFARDKTTYCYFAIASSTCFPYDTDLRLILSKIGVLITVIDDFFDKEGSLDELRILADAVQRWDKKALRNQSMILFDALDNYLAETAKKYLDEHHTDITNNLRKIWYELIASWLTEATWSRTGEVPSMASYIEIGMISITAHLIVLQGSCFLTKSFNPHNLNPSQYETITRLLMTSCRLLNDLQTYERELNDGKINSVLLHIKENPDASIDEAVVFVENILKGSNMRFLEHALTDGIGDDNDFPRPCKMLHLAVFKVFQMFYNSGNNFDSKDSLLDDINKAIFVPLEDHTSKKINPPIEVWNIVGFPSTSSSSTSSFLNRLFENLSSTALYHSSPWHIFFSFLLWFMWKRRNAWIFELNNIKAQQTVILALKSSLEFLSFQDINSKPTSPPQLSSDKVPWPPPPHHSIKINVDATWDKNTCALAGVARNHHGQWILGFRKVVVANSAKMAEILEIREGLLMVVNKHWENVILASDCKQAVEEINDDDFQSGPYINLLLDCRELRPQSSRIQVLFEQRSKNQ